MSVAKIPLCPHGCKDEEEQPKFLLRQPFGDRRQCPICKCVFHQYKTRRRIRLEDPGDNCETGQEQHGPQRKKWTWDAEGNPEEIIE